MNTAHPHVSRAASAACLIGILSACGGGGDVINSQAETNTGRMSITVTGSALSVGAGQSATLEATAIARGLAPASMVWSVAPLSSSSPNDPAPTLSDANCGNATYAPAISSMTTGRGYCQVILSAPVNARSGVWRITNTATASGIGVVSHFVDVGLTALPDSGFRVVESSAPVVGYANNPLTLNMPWAVNPGVAVSNVTYQWEADPQNPTATTIVGASNPSASVMVNGAGIYRFKLTVNADVNGRRTAASGSVVALVYQQELTSAISAGDPKVASFNEAVSLAGAVNSPGAYSVAWSQLDGIAGGPVRVILSNVNTLNSGFIAPATAGLYGFELTAIKKLPDGTQAILKSQTTVQVQAQVNTVAH